MSKPRKATGRSSALPKAPTRRSATPGRVPPGNKGRAAPGAPSGKVAGRAAGAPSGKVARRAAGAGAAKSRSSGRASEGAGAGSRGYEARGASRRRSGVGGDQVEGRQAVRELLLAGRRRVREIWLLADAEPSPIVEDIIELAAAERVTVREVARGKFYAAARCEAPQGVLAMAAEIPEVPFEELAAGRPGGQPPFLIALDGVTDPGNLGALLRSAECSGVTGVLLPRHRAVHVTPTVTKAAAGAVEHLRFTIVGGLPTALAQLRQHGVWVVGLDAEGATGLWDLPSADGPICLVLGAEGTGLSRLVRQRCDEIVGIPLLGALTSLNVATAGALACFEVARARAR